MIVVSFIFAIVAMCLFLGFCILLIRKQSSRIENLENMNDYLVSKLRMLDASQKGDYPTARFAYQAMQMSPPLSAGAPDETEETEETEEIVEETPAVNNTDVTFTQIG